MKEVYKYYASRCTANRVYPMSIAQGYQTGKMICDDENNVHAVLFWHFSGFAYLSGDVSEEFLSKIYRDFFHAEHKSRFVLITDKPDVIRFFSKKEELMTDKRIEYSFDPAHPFSIDVCDFMIERISDDNIENIQGKIIPSFSWESDRQFLKNGFGYVARDKKICASVAFSAAVSSDEIDIGVETIEEYRHHNLAKILAERMCREIISMGKKPVWAHSVTNTASMKTALSVGFKASKENTIIRKRV